MDIGLLKQLDNNQVIFFDGYCNLCSSLLDFISSKDIATRFAFIPLQSELALQVLIQNGYPVEKIKNLFLRLITNMESILGKEIINS